MRCAVVGDPITHSLSPVLHRAGYAAAGLDWEYDAHRVPAGGLAGFLAGLDHTWRGLSVTAPLKREALGLAATVSDAARLAGAANTLVLAGPGVFADNTDVPGAAAALRERYAGPVTRGLVVGGGATATSTALALSDLGATEIGLLVRSEARARETVDTVRSHPANRAVHVHPITGAATAAEQTRPHEVVVSTVPAAAQSPQLVERLVTTTGVRVVFEALYDPWPTPLARAAGEAGLVVVGGLDLLLHQAVRQFEQFTGTEAPLEAMRTAGAAELARRSAPGG
jgi:shikimate dehydrogenase